MTDVPDIGTADWRYWVIGKLADIERGAIADADIATIIGINGSKTRIAINQMIADGDAAVTEALTGAITASAQSTGVAANRYADAVADNALRDAKKYTDQHAGSGGVSQTYVDDRDTATLSSAEVHTDNEVSLVRTEVKNYADDAASEALASAKSDAAAGDAATLTAAKAYTDAHSGSGGGVSEQYVIDAVAQGVTDAGTAATQADQQVVSSLTNLVNNTANTTEQNANDYTDTAVAQSASSVSGQAQTMANTAESNAKAYADDNDDTLATNLSASFDVKVASGVADANTYTDQKIAAIPASEITKAYVDSGDSNTLNAAKTDASNTYVTKASAVPEKTASAVVRRDANGRFSANDPTASDQVATKGYVDARVGADGEWSSLTYDSATYGATANPGAKIIGGTVQMRGQLNKSTAWVAVNGFAKVPSNCIPAQDVVGIATTSDAGTARIIIRSGTGNIDVTHIGSTTTTALRFDMIRYPLS